MSSDDGSLLRAGVAALLLLLPGFGAARARQLSTTTTHYTYNADGELTAVTTQVDDQAPATTYLTWDDFVPNAADPSTGTMSMGDGNLVSYGSLPGSGSQEARFDFDRRDRLVGYSNAQHSIAYDHHATGLMSSATADGADGWHFYYDDSQNPQVSNIYEPSTQRWSGYLGAARFVSDGEEQVLVEPRKDLVCEYDPRSQSVEVHSYNAYGTQENATPAEGYDLSDNPFQYAGEFREPLWGGIYLRARWYDPDFPIFLSRDPMPGQLNHYGYAGGNPVMNTDPGGERFGRGLKKFTSGIGGHFARLLLSPFLAPLELAAHPKAFWKQLRPNNPTFYFTLAGVAFEFAGPVADFVAPVWVNSLSLSTRFTVRLGTDATLGFGQSVAQAAETKGFKHFDWNTFGQGAEYTVGGIGWARGLAGVGYRPFGIRSKNLEVFANAKLANLENREALIFRERVPLRSTRLNWTSPLQEWRNIGVYHERLVAVTKEGTVFTNEVFESGLKRGRFNTVREFLDAPEAVEEGGEVVLKPKPSTRLQFVGVKGNFTGVTLGKLNPLRFPTVEEAKIYKGMDQPLPAKFRRYDWSQSNCQDHTAAVLEELGTR